MVGCCANYCSNKSEMGFHFYRFPKDPKRRQVWLEKVNRINGSIMPGSKLCERHFERNQFENKRKDGRKLLKWTAVPTIFTGRKVESSEKSGKELEADDNAVTTQDTSATDSEMGDIFDAAFLSSLDHINLIGFEGFINQINSSFMSMEEIINKINHLTFCPGILKDSIQLLKRKLMLPKYCSLSVDVLPIERLVQFESTGEFFIGCVAPLAAELKIASEIVIFMVTGFETEFTRIVGYMLINFDQDSWALWHFLCQIIKYLLDNSIFVVNVSLNRRCGIDALRKNSHVEFKADTWVEHLFDGLVALCFSRDVNELVEDLSECLMLHDINLSNEIVKKFSLEQKVFKQENLRLLVGNEALSSQSILSWLLGWKEDYGGVDLTKICYQSENFLMHIMGKWSSIMLASGENDALRSVCSKTQAHIQFLYDFLWLVNALEKTEVNSDLLELWKNMRTTTTSVITLYMNYVHPKKVTCLKTSSLKCLTLNDFKNRVWNTDTTKPTPLSTVHFMRIVNSAFVLNLKCGEHAFKIDSTIQMLLKYENNNENILPEMAGLGLYFLSSHIITKLLSINKCDKCQASLVAKKVNKDIPSLWTTAIESKGLLHPSLSVYDTLQWAESHLINTEEDVFRLHRVKSQLSFRVFGEMSFSIRNTFPSCHNILRKMLSLFIDIRLQMVAEDLTKNIL